MVTGKFYKFASQKRIDKPSRMRYITKTSHTDMVY